MAETNLAALHANHIGEHVIDSKSGAKVPTVSLFSGKSKFVALYFAAEWSPPCRSFTPVLVNFVEKVRASGNYQIDVIYISYDRDLDGFKDYFKSMPWHAMEFVEEDPEPRDALMDRYEIQAVPAVILFEGNGKELLRNGLEAITNDPDAKVFPWRKK